MEKNPVQGVNGEHKGEAVTLSRPKRTAVEMLRCDQAAGITRYTETFFLTCVIFSYMTLVV